MPYSISIQHPLLGHAPHKAQLQGPGALGVLPPGVGGHERPLVEAHLGGGISGALAQQDGLGAHGGHHVDVQVPSPGHVDRDDCLDVLQIVDEVFLPLACVGRECQHQLASGQNFPEGRVVRRHSEGWGHYPRFFFFFLIFGCIQGHMAPSLPHQGSNPYPLHWKSES